MGLYHNNSEESYHLHDPDAVVVVTHDVGTTITNRINEELTNLEAEEEEEIDIDISISDSSILWDLRQLFDLDFITRDQSPYPRGDSADIPSEILSVVTPLLGDGCPDENNLNVTRQTNQNNITEPERRSTNTCLKNLTRVIHNSDQVKDILFSGTREKAQANNNTSQLPNNPLSWSDSPADISTKNFKNERVTKTAVQKSTNLPKTRRKQQQQKKSRRKVHYSSSSSSSSSRSSCSCSSRRRNNHRCHCLQTCRPQGCNNAPCRPSCHAMSDPCGYANQTFPLPCGHVLPQNMWNPLSVGPAQVADIYPNPYSGTMAHGDQTYYPQEDMSDIIERIHRLDLNITQWTKENDPQATFDDVNLCGEPHTYENDYFVYH